VFDVNEHLGALRNLTSTGVAFGAEWAPAPTGPEQATQ
jgi:hypothetical protein